MCLNNNMYLSNYFKLIFKAERYKVYLYRVLISEMQMSLNMSFNITCFVKLKNQFLKWCIKLNL